MSSTVILGAGIIGVSTAYYLSEHQLPSSIHLVEPSLELFSSASGLAGGFLAKDWFTPSVASLGTLSFDQHRRLAENNNGRTRWGYSTSTAVSYSTATKESRPVRRGDEWLREGTSRAEAAAGGADTVLSGKSPSWLRRADGDQLEVISEEGTTAQVNPLQLCRFLVDECQSRGVQLHHPGKAVSLHKDLRDELSSIHIALDDSSNEIDIPCSRLIIAAGAWTPQVFQTLFPSSSLVLPISSLAGHSLLVSSRRWTVDMESHGCHAVFTTSAQGKFSPEVFSRIGGHIYVAGLNSAKIPLPALPDESKVQEEDVVQLKATAEELLGSDADADDLTVVRESVCFRPVTAVGTPIIGRIEDAELGAGMATRPGADGGVFVAAGHGPWGISLSLGTGMVLAEMAQGRSLSADVGLLGIR